MTHNEAGIALHRKMGFHIEGTRKEGPLVNGTWRDEYVMGKVLPSSSSDPGRLPA